jgi:hypothetical protein
LRFGATPDQAICAMIDALDIELLHRFDTVN